MVLRAILTTDRCGEAYQIGEVHFILGAQYSLLGTQSESDFFSALKSSRIMRNSGLRKFEPMAPKRNQCRRKHRNFGLGQDAADAGDRLDKAGAGDAFIDSVHEPSRQIAAIVEVGLNQRILGLIEFV